MRSSPYILRRLAGPVLCMLIAPFAPHVSAQPPQQQPQQPQQSEQPKSEQPRQPQQTQQSGTEQTQEIYLRRPALGVVVREAPFPLLERLGLPYGVQVQAVVPDGPAAEAGVQPGDLITALDGSPVYSPNRLKWLIRDNQPGQTVTLELIRNGEQTSVQVDPQPLGAPPARGPMGGSGQGMPFLGIRMQPLTGALRERMQAPPQGGVLVAEIKPDGPAAEAGLQAGDVILRIDRRRIGGIQDVYRALNFFDPGDQVEIELQRDGQRQTLTATLDETRTSRGTQGMPRQHWMQPPAGEWPRSMQEFMEMFDQPGRAGPPQWGPFAPPPGAGPGGDATLDPGVRL